MTVYRVSNNTDLAAVTTAQGDTVLFLAGTQFSAASIPSGFLAPSSLTLGVYGSGDKPIISGGVARSDWVYDAGNNVYSRIAASNILGNVTEDGIPMKFVAWNTDIATTASSMVSGSNGIYWSGSFAYNPATFTIYIRPSSGVAADHAYVTSESLYGLFTATSGTGTVIDGLSFKNISRHGIALQNRKSVSISGCDFAIMGGHYISVHVGNGIELAENCHGAAVSGCSFVDIFDTAATSQAYATSAARITGHTYTNNTVRRFGMHGIEVSAHTANQLVEGIEVDGMTAIDGGAGWSGDRNGAVITNICTNTTNTRINKSFARNVRSTNCRRLYIGYQTGGLCGIEDAAGVGTYGVAPTSNANGRTGQVDLWRNVTDNLGAPSGGVWAQTTADLSNNFRSIV